MCMCCVVTIMIIIVMMMIIIILTLHHHYTTTTDWKQLKSLLFKDGWKHLYGPPGWLEVDGKGWLCCVCVCVCVCVYSGC